MRHLHVLLKLLDVGVGVCEALLQLGELLLLALADSVILLGLLALTESISGSAVLVIALELYSYDHGRESKGRWKLPWGTAKFVGYAGHLIARNAKEVSWKLHIPVGGTS